ncbi:achelase-1-like isoform X2 [Helicoverpa zea]|uniref:achelase-1-like isoform X2 n=1 Tax=Helicoverpa zea TaxID=7113 RepID=UPI001F59660C|nr:achelase-1-like isoform X2 [Helicoverpa zea]
MWDIRTNMWCVTLLLIAVASCNAESFELKTAELSSQTVSRIVGGVETTVERYPFIVQVLYNGQFNCGGSLLTSRHVLSAGHCFVNKFGYVLPAILFAIRMGTTFLNTGGSLHQVSTVIVHESFNNPSRDNDVAVVVLSTAATLSSSVQFAVLGPRGQELPDNTSVTAVGWGLTNARTHAMVTRAGRCCTGICWWESPRGAGAAPSRRGPACTPGSRITPTGSKLRFSNITRRPSAESGPLLYSRLYCS